MARIADRKTAMTLTVSVSLSQGTEIPTREDLEVAIQNGLDTWFSGDYGDMQVTRVRGTQTALAPKQTARRSTRRSSR